MPFDNAHADELLMRRIRILNAELRALRHAHGMVASGANVHVMNGLLSNIALALHLADTAAVNARPETIPTLLLMAEEELSRARALHFQAARTRRWRA